MAAITPSADAGRLGSSNLAMPQLLKKKKKKKKKKKQSYFYYQV
jgi:hypothetical protein